MAAKKDDFAQQQSLFNKELKEGTFHRVYLLCGEQAYLRIQNRDRLRAALLGDGDQMNVSVYTGMDVTAREIIDEAMTLPFFADRRVILMENSVFFSKKASTESDALAAFLPEIPETASLVFVEESPDKRKKLYKAVQKNGFILNCEDLSPRMLGQWTGGLFKKAGLMIDGTTLNLFLETVGEDMMNIVSESEKLIGYMNDVKFSVNSYTMNRVTIKCGAAAVRDKTYFEETCAKIINTRENAKKELTKRGFTFPDSMSNFIFAKHETASANMIFEELKKRRIFVRHWNKPVICDYLRITVGTDDEMNALYKALDDILKEAAK